MQWCEFCQSRPADGELLVQFVKDGPVERLFVCTPCAIETQQGDTNDD
jgi:protein-arginine kinase activator protein McsA